MKRIYLFFALFASILSQEAFAISILLDGTQTRLSGTQCQAVTYRFGTQSSYQNQAIDIILEVTAQDNEYSNNKCVDIIDNVVGFRIRDKDSNDDRAYMDIKVTVVKKGTTIPLTVDTITVTNFDLDNNPSYTNTDDVYYKNPSKVYLSEFTNVTQTNGNFFNNYTKKLKGQSTGNCNDNASLLQQECRGGVSFDNTSVFYARVQNDNAYGTYNNANSYRLIQFSFELKDLAPLMSNIQIPCGTVENYSTSSNVWINGTNSSQYTNNLNILKTIEIPHAQNIRVTMNGATEQDYDFLYIYDENNTEIYSNSGNFNNIPLTISGSKITLKLTSDGSVTQSGVSVEIEGLGCTSSGCTENPTAIEVKISHNNDDVEERVSNGDMDMSSTDLEMTQESHQQIVGLRFRNLTIPKGATVTNAYIQFTADETDSGNTNLTIYGEKSDNAQSFSNSDYDVSSRTKTTASSSWSPVAWNSTNEQSSKQKTSDLTAIIQEIIDRDGWNNGNAMAFIISGTGKRVADSYNGSSSKAPYLHIEFNNCSEPTTSTATCYALPDNNSKVYRVLMSPNGSPLPVPTTLNISRTFNGEGSAYRASNHTLYAFSEGSNSDLYTINLATGNVNKIKDGLLNGSVEGAEFYYDPLQQQEILYVTSEEVNSKLYAFYADTWILLNGYPKNIHGSTTTIDSLAINPINGETYASDDYDYNHVSPKLHQLNLQTGETTFKVQVQGTIDAEGLAYASDGNLYVEDEGYFNGRKIYKIDVDTGALTPSALLGGSDDVEGLSCNGTQIAIDYPSLTFTNTSVVEGNSSTTDLIFTITLSKPAVETITFDYTIIDGNTTVNQDYIYESNRTITIPKDATTGTVTIRVNGDTDLEEDESFTLQLSNIKNAMITTTTIVGTIINDDEPPELKSIGEFRFDNCDEEWKTDYSATNNPIVGGTKISIHKDDDKTYMSDSASSYDNSDAKIPHHTDYEIDKGTLSMLIYDHHNVSTYRYNLLEKGNLVIKTVRVNNDNTKGSIDITLNGHTIHTNEIYWTTQDQGDDFDTQWVHLSFTFGLQGMKLYINGELKGSNSYTGGLSGNSSDFILPNISGYYDELYLFEEQATNTQINELYNNTINNKNIDGTDRVDIPCINIRPITCENSAFMLHDLPTEFSLLNLTTGDMNLQTSTLSSTKINGAGYNKKDGYIWAYDQIKKDGTLLRIGKNQNNEFLNDTFQIPNLNISTYVADIDDNGHFYLKEGGFDSLSVHVIDLDVNSSTYLTKIRTFNLGQKINIHDWAFNPLDDQLYAVTKGFPNNLYKINPNDGVVTLLGDTQINNQSGAFGASFFDKDGRFYAYNNQGGVFVIEPQISPIASLFSNTNAVSKNDGAMCSDAEVVQPPRIYISNEQATEGDSGTTNLTFTISLDKPAGTGVSFDWQVFDGDNSSIIKNAIAPSDYSKLNTPTHVTLNGTAQTHTFSIAIKGDTVVEDDEEFYIIISNIQGAIAGDINATGTILNDDSSISWGQPTDLDEDNDGVLDEIEFGDYPNLVQNPSFEADDCQDATHFQNAFTSVNGTFVGNDYNNNQIANWNYTSNIDCWVEGTLFALTPHGKQYIDLQGNLKVYGSGSEKIVQQNHLTQTITTIPNKTYRFSFQWGEDVGHKIGEPIVFTMKIIDATNNTMLSNETLNEVAGGQGGQYKGPNTWYTYEAFFVATSTQTTLDFSATPPAGNLSAGADIDMVSVKEVADSDNDGVPDFLDLDSDNDGIPDTVEIQTTKDYIKPTSVFDGNGVDIAFSGGFTPVDTDEDNVSDYLDLDSDNDAIFDIEESGLGNNDTDNDGRTNQDVGLNGLDNTSTHENNDTIDDVNGMAYENNIFHLKDSDFDTLVNGSNAIPIEQDFDYRDKSYNPTKLNMSSQKVLEGNSGEKDLTFRVVLDKQSAQTVSFDYQIFEGNSSNTVENATTPSDYTTLFSGIKHIVLDNNSSNFNIVVSIKGDEIVEDDEKFHIVITNIQGAILGDINATGVILNDDSAISWGTPTDLDEDNDGVLDEIEFGEYPNLVQNPSFEDDDCMDANHYPNAFTSIDGTFLGNDYNNNQLTAWNYTSNIDCWVEGHSFALTPHGKQYIDLQGNLKVYGSGSEKIVQQNHLTQTITTIPNKTYRFSFQWGEDVGHKIGEPIVFTMKVIDTLNNTMLSNETLNEVAGGQGGQYKGPNTWYTYEAFFVATSTQTKLDFSATTPTNNLSAGADIDMVSVKEVADSDNDGVPDFLDLDSDNDGIPDTIEIQTTQDYIKPTSIFDNDGIDIAFNGGFTPVDTDEDNISDYLDLDSDNDTIFDIKESGLGNNDTDNDGRTNQDVGTNGLDVTNEHNDTLEDINGVAYEANIFTLKDSDNDTDDNGANALPRGRDFDYRDNTDNPLMITINGIEKEEGDSGETPFIIPVTLSRPAPVGGITIEYTPKGDVVYSDDFADPKMDDYFAENPNSQNGNSNNIKIRIYDALITEGDAGTQLLDFQIKLNKKAPEGGVTVQVQPHNITANEGEDYVRTGSSVYFAQGEKSSKVSLIINGDTIEEPDETFEVELHNPVNATLHNNQFKAIGTIKDDDSTNNAGGYSSGNDSYKRYWNSWIIFSFSYWKYSLYFDTTYSSYEQYYIQHLNRTPNEQYPLVTAKRNSKIKNQKSTQSKLAVTVPLSITINEGETEGNITIWIQGDTNVEENEPFNLEFEAFNGVQFSTTQQNKLQKVSTKKEIVIIIMNDDANLTDKLVAEYRMDECDWSTTVKDVFDSSGNNHHGMAKGNAQTLNGAKIGRSGSFNGGGDTIEINDLNLSTPYSVTAWLKDNNSSWYHAVIVNDGNSSKFYINGVKDVTLNQNSIEIPTFFTTLNHISFNGQIDEVKLFSTLLKDAQIKDIYDNENMGKDWYTGQIRTAPICIAPTNIGEYRFDCFVNGGYPDYSNIENNLSTTIISSTREDSSILCSAVDTNNSSITIPDNNAYHINQGSFSFWLRDKESILETGYLVKKSNFKVGFKKINNNIGKIEITLANGTKVTSSSTYNTTSPQWQFITITFEDGGDIKLYIDAILEAQSSYDNAFNNSSPITLANYSGQFDELYLFEGVLSQKRVNDLYNQQKANINLDGIGRVCDCSLMYPFVSLTDMSQREGDSGLSTFSLNLTLNNPAPANASVRLKLHDGNSAESQVNALVLDDDYLNNGQIIPIPFNSQNIEINISVKGDTKLERDEKFEVELYDLVNLMATDLRAKVTILNDDMVSLNVERTDSNNNNNQDGTNDNLDKKFNLYTQIAKKDFAYSLVAYDLNDSSKERGISNLTVKVELINQMDSNNSTNVLDTKVHTFDNNQSRIDVPIGNGLSSILSTKYANFKISYPMDINNSLIPNNNCNSVACLTALPTFDHFESTNSKDGFAIRPAGFKLMLWADDGTVRDHLATSNQDEPYGIALASGYEYELQVQALGDTGLIETDYDPQTLYSNKPANILYPHQEVNATLEFDGNETHCDDVEEEDLKYYDFIDGINKTQNFSHDNVGNFIIKVKDENWTNADQSADNSKRGCIFNSTSNEPDMDGLFGCDIYTTFDIHSVDPLYNHYYDLKVYFQPYSFDVNITVASKQDSGHNDFLYMSDLEKSKDMSIEIDGDIIAKEKNGKITTNFTKGCFAKPVKLSLEYSILTDQGEFTNSHPQEIRTSDYHDVVPIQRSVKYGNNNYLTVENSEFLDNNITLAENNFEDNQTGISHLSILYNIKKHLSKSINPIKISLLKANISSEQAGSNLADNEIRNFTPTGEKDLNTTKTLYFTRVTSDRENYPITYGDSESTPLNVEIFCQNNILWCNKMLKDDMNQSNGEYTATRGWYTSVNHNNQFDGGVEEYEKDETVDVNESLEFKNGRISDLVTKLSKNDNNDNDKIITLFEDANRTDTMVEVNVTSWLLYHPARSNGKPFWKNHFVSSSIDENATNAGELSGIGQAGNMINTSANTRPSNKMDW